MKSILIRKKSDQGKARLHSTLVRNKKNQRMAKAHSGHNKRDEHETYSLTSIS